MPEATLYLFDGFNVLHAGDFGDVRDLTDTLASFVAVRGARGIVVFDGVGRDETFGPLEVRYAENADALLERLATENRQRERVCLVSSDLAVRGTSGQEVAHLGSRTFVRDLEPTQHRESKPGHLGDRLDPEVRAKLERLRRGEH
ncbi:MAG: NYN domain-containing protein [Actinobacteria bacterium]|nr:NYN domain-containing protein [Actinomycetota bacterium]